jgi:hypothetical protein
LISIQALILALITVAIASITYAFNPSLVALINPKYIQTTIALIVTVLDSLLILRIAFAIALARALFSLFKALPLAINGFTKLFVLIYECIIAQLVKTNTAISIAFHFLVHILLGTLDGDAFIVVLLASLFALLDSSKRLNTALKVFLLGIFIS